LARVNAHRSDKARIVRIATRQAIAQETEIRRGVRRDIRDVTSRFRVFIQRDQTRRVRRRSREVLRNVKAETLAQRGSDVTGFHFCESLTILQPAEITRESRVRNLVDDSAIVLDPHPSRDIAVARIGLTLGPRLNPMLGLAGVSGYSARSRIIRPVAQSNAGELGMLTAEFVRGFRFFR